MKCDMCDGNGWVEDPSDGGTMTCPECEGETMECVTCGSREDDVEIRDCEHALCDDCEEGDDCYKCQDT